MRLFRRFVKLTVGTVNVDPSLRIVFKSTKSYKPDTNTCDVQIYNLKPENREAISKLKTPLVQLAAGYGVEEQGLTQLFYGHVLGVTNEVRGSDIVTTVSTTDGGEKKQTARINVSFKPDTKTGTVLKRLAEALGLKPGNVTQIASAINLSGKADIYQQGTSISGSAANEMGHLLRSCGYDWSIQDETIQIRKLGEAASGFAVRLNPKSGLIDSPSVSSKGVCSGVCLLFKAGTGLDLVPGRLIQIDSKFVQGQFILAKTESSGDNYSDDWYCRFQAVTRKSDLGKVT